MKNHGGHNTEQHKRIKQIEGGHWEICWLALNPQNEKVVHTYLNLEKYRTHYHKDAVMNGQTSAEAATVAEGKVAKRVEEFKERAKIALSIGEHPYITKVYKMAYDEDLKQDFLITEFVDGVAIDKAVKGMTAEQVAFLYLNVLEALQPIHEKGRLHLNIKPDVILVYNKKNGLFEAKLNRLGFLYPEGQSSYPMIGTPATIAPELIVEQRADKRSDICSLGITFYRSLTDQFPFKRPSVHGGKDRLIKAVKSETEPPPPSSAGKIEGINPAFDAIVLRSMKKNPDERFQNVVQTKKALIEAYPKIAEGLVSVGVTKASELQSLPEED